MVDVYPTPIYNKELKKKQVQTITSVPVSVLEVQVIKSVPVRLLFGTQVASRTRAARYCLLHTSYVRNHYLLITFSGCLLHYVRKRNH